MVMIRSSSLSPCPKASRWWWKTGGKLITKASLNQFIFKEDLLIKKGGTAEAKSFVPLGDGGFFYCRNISAFDQIEKYLSF